MTVADLLAREVARDPGRPFLTWYDDSTGDRVELSYVTTANWAAKIAGFLTEEHDAEAGTTFAVALPLHWVTAVLMLGVWRTGAALTLEEPADVDLDVSLDAMGVALSRIVGAQPDAFLPIVPVDLAAPALVAGGRTWTHGQLADAGVAAAAHHSIDASARILTTLPFDTIDALDIGLLVPLAAGASVVLVANPDQERLQERCTTERVTHTAGVSVAALPRLG